MWPISSNNYTIFTYFIYKLFNENIFIRISQISISVSKALISQIAYTKICLLYFQIKNCIGLIILSNKLVTSNNKLVNIAYKINILLKIAFECICLDLRRLNDCLLYVRIYPSFNLSEYLDLRVLQPETCSR